MKKKEYSAPRILVLGVETAAPMAASVTTISISNGSGDYTGDFYSKKHYDVWEDDEQQ